MRGTKGHFFLMQQKIFRDKNKEVVMSWVRRIKSIFINKSKIYDGNGLAPDVIRAMYLMAKMKDIATEGDIGFAGYFIDKNDRYYFVTNIEGMNDD